MADNIVTIPYSYFPDFSVGRPLFNADIYVGEPDLDPEDIPLNQKEIKLRTGDGTEVVVSQPVNTGSGGVISYNGSPATIITDGAYSVLVNNSQGSQVYYSRNVTLGTPITPESLGGLTNYQASSIDDMIAGLTVSGDTVEHFVGLVWRINGGWRVTSTPVTSIDDFESLDGKIYVTDFGAVGDGVTDDSDAIDAARAVEGITYFPFTENEYVYSRQITFVSGDHFKGDGMQTYGSSNRGKGSTLKFTSAVTGYCMTTDASATETQGVVFEDMTFFGEPTNDWMFTHANCREFIFNRVAVKGFGSGGDFTQLWATSFIDVSISTLVNGLRWLGTGQSTTLDFRNLKISSYDPANRMTLGLELNNVSQCKLGGFIQQCDTAVSIKGLSVVNLSNFYTETVDICLDYEPSSHSNITIGGGSYLIHDDVTDGALIKLTDPDGSIGAQSTLAITDMYFVPIYTNGSKFIDNQLDMSKISLETSNSFSVLIDQQVYDWAYTGIDENIEPVLRVARAPRGISPDFIKVNAGDTLSIYDLPDLYRNKLMYDKTNDNYSWFGTKGANFGNGFTYKVSGVGDTGFNDNVRVSYLDVRTQSGTEHCYITPTTYGVPVTYDDTTKLLTFGGEGQFLISANV